MAFPYVRQEDVVTATNAPAPVSIRLEAQPLMESLPLRMNVAALLLSREAPKLDMLAVLILIGKDTRY